MENINKDIKEISAIKVKSEKISEEKVLCLKTTKKKIEENVMCLKSGKEKTEEKVMCLKTAKEESMETVLCLKTGEIGEEKKEDYDYSIIYKVTKLNIIKKIVLLLKDEYNKTGENPIKVNYPLGLSFIPEEDGIYYKACIISGEKIITIGPDIKYTGDIQQKLQEINFFFNEYIKESHSSSVKNLLTVDLKTNLKKTVNNAVTENMEGILSIKTSSLSLSSGYKSSFIPVEASIKGEGVSPGNMACETLFWTSIIKQLDREIKETQKILNKETKLSEVLKAFNKETERILSTKATMEVINAIIAGNEGKTIEDEGTEGWLEKDGIATYKGSYYTLSYKPSKRQEHLNNSIIKIITELDDITADVYLYCLAAFYSGSLKKNSVIIKVNDILEARRIKPKMKNNVFAGYKKEDRQAIIDRLYQLDSMEIDIFSETGYTEEGEKKEITVSSKPVAIKNIIKDRKNNSIAGFEITIGRYGERLKEDNYKLQTAAFARKSLEYNPYKETWEKRISKYLYFHWRRNASKNLNLSYIKVSTFINKVVRKEIKSERPQRIKARLEKALNTLEKDNLISSWKYKIPLNEKNIKEVDLPGQNWLDSWMTHTMEIVPPDWIMEHYKSIYSKRNKVRKL